MARGSRPLTLIRPEGLAPGANLSVIRLPPTVTRGLEQVSARYPVIPLPALALDYSNGLAQDSVSLFYLTASPVTSSSATYQTYAYGHDAFLGPSKTWTGGVKVGYSSLAIDRDVQISGSPQHESVKYSGWSVLGVLGRQSSGMSESGAGGLVPYVGFGYWSFRTSLDVDFSNLHVAGSHYSSYGDVGVAGCMAGQEVCVGLDMTSDADTGRVVMGTLYLRR
jgi:hypothetical protein